MKTCRDLPTLFLVDLTAKSANKVYNKPGAGDSEPFGFVQVGESKKIEADVFGGSIKATNVSLFKARTQDSGTIADDIRVVVVAIRGTASIHDWLVNFNDARKPAAQLGVEASVRSEFLVSCQRRLI